MSPDACPLKSWAVPTNGDGRSSRLQAALTAAWSRSSVLTVTVWDTNCSPVRSVSVGSHRDEFRCELEADSVERRSHRLAVRPASLPAVLQLTGRLASDERGHDQPAQPIGS